MLSPDPNVFQHTNALAGLKEGGVFIIQSDADTPEAMWESIPPVYQKIIIDKKIKVFYLDAFKIAREEAPDPDLQLRFNEQVPVVMADGRELCHHFLDEDRLRRYLEPG